MIKDPESRYQPGARAWSKLRARTTTEAIIGAVTGSVRAPSTLLLGRRDDGGRLRLVARSTPLSRRAADELGAAVRPGDSDHPWYGKSFSAGWGRTEPLEVQLVLPDLVAEFAGDTAVDLGRYRHPVRYLRLRGDMAPDDVRERAEGLPRRQH